MIPFFMIMGSEVHQRLLQRSLSKEDHTVETFGFHGSEIAFEIGVQIRTSGRQEDNLGGGHRIHVRAEWAKLCVAVNDQVIRASQKSVFTVGQVSGHLFRPAPVGVRRDSDDLDPARLQTHGDQNVERGQSGFRPDLDGGEIYGGY